MWKLLRNLVVFALLCVVALKLVLWYEIQQGAARFAARLAPLAQVQYANASAGLDGAVGLGDVTVTLTRERVREVWRAAQVDIATPGALWLARRLVVDDDSLPEHLGITIKGLQVPAAALGPGAAAISPLSLVPFETFGCGVVTRFSVADYQRMGLNPGTPQQHVEYRYDPAAATLTLAAELASPPFSTISMHAELQKFDPRALAGNWQKLHAAELNVAYSDSGYLAKRNRFCAQQAGVTPAQFLDQHVAAVDAFLLERGIQPSAPVEALYRSLVVEGGRISVLSLPPAASSVGQLLAETPDVMTRQLNLTARRNDAPPVMVRLGFVAPDELPAAASAEPAPQPPAEANRGPATAAAAPAPPAPAPATRPPAVTAVAPRATAAAPAAKAPLPTPPPPTAPSTAARPLPATTTVAAATPPPHPAPATPPTATSASAVAAAKAAPPGAPGNAAGAGSDELASGPPPPEGSTLALVWKPTVDRLQPDAPAARDYEVIDIAALGGYTGRYVRLLTKTGKKVEGHVISVDATSVGMRIQQPGGVAELQVPRSVIVEVQLPRQRRLNDNG